MKLPRRPRRQPALVYALYINAALLLALLIAVLSRGNGLGSSASAAPQMTPMAGGGSLYLMPAQFSINTWGCYVLDIDTQNICAYQYLPGANQLRFVASRNIHEDRKLREWNTAPPLSDIARYNQVQEGGIRGANAPGNAPGTGQTTQPSQDSNPPIRFDVPVPTTGPAEQKDNK